MSQVAEGASVGDDLFTPVGYKGADGKWHAAGGAVAPGQATAAASMPVVLAQGGALTDRSGTITTGGTAQNSTAVLNTSRRYLYLENPIYKAAGAANTAERLCYSLDTTADVGSPSICLDPGQNFEYSGTFVPTGAVSVIAATTGHAYIIKEG